ncbi:MAG: Thiol peroxidase, Bcp-type, partial [uncultured Sphingomonas sp.]
DRRRQQGTGGDAAGGRRDDRPRRARSAAGALLLPQGRHFGLHPRSAGLHRAGRRVCRCRGQGRRRLPRSPEEPF